MLDVTRGEDKAKIDLAKYNHRVHTEGSNKKISIC